MDSVRIDLICDLLGSQISLLVKNIPIFVSRVRIARQEMDKVLREIISLQLCLIALRENDQTGTIRYTSTLKLMISQIISNTDAVVRRIQDIVAKPPSSQVDRGYQWYSTDRIVVVQHQVLLESNRVSLEMAVTMATIAMLTDHQKTLVGRRDSRNSLPEFTEFSQRNDLLEASQLESLQTEIGNFCYQAVRLSTPNVEQFTSNFVIQARNYIINLLQPFPYLYAQLATELNERLDDSCPSTGVRPSGSSKELSIGQRKIIPDDGRALSPIEKCPACTRILIVDEDRIAVKQFFEKQKNARTMWQKQLDKERADVAELEEEISQLQEQNTILQRNVEQDLDFRISEVTRDKDMIIQEKDHIISGLQRDLYNSAFYIAIRKNGLSLTVEEARRSFQKWEKAQRLDDPSYNSGAPQEDLSDTTTTAHDEVDQSEPITPEGDDVLSGQEAAPEAENVPEKMCMEFSVAFIQDVMMFRSLRGTPMVLSKAITIQSYQTVDDVKQRILIAAAEQSPPLNIEYDLNCYYISKVSQRYYSSTDGPSVEVQALPSDLQISKCGMLNGDKIRLMQGPPRHRREDQSDTTNQGSGTFQNDGNLNEHNESTRMRHKLTKSQDEDLPEVNFLPKKRAAKVRALQSNTIPISVNTVPTITTHPYSNTENTVSTSRIKSEPSQMPVKTNILKPTGLKSSPIFAFHVERNGPKLSIKPKYLIGSHHHDRTLQPNHHQEYMISIQKQVNVDPVYFTDEDPTGNLKRYISELLRDFLRYMGYDHRRIFLQHQSRLLYNTQRIREYGMLHYSTIWVMLKPLVPLTLSTASNMYPYSTVGNEIPDDSDLLIEEPDCDRLSFLSFSDSSFRSVYRAQRHSRAQSNTTTTSLSRSLR